MTVILASSSPRRRDLLSRLDVPFTVVPSTVAERPPRRGEDPVAYALELASQKAKDVARRFPFDVILGADTVVVAGEQILGKPANGEDAIRMLALLRGQIHSVVTGVAVVCGTAESMEASTAFVRMRDFSPREVEEYVAGGEPMDKAGAYAVQGTGGRLVQTVEGCFNAVVGLPLCVTGRLLEGCGVPLHHAAPEICDHRP